MTAFHYAIVIGASSGIGLETAKLLAKQGARVALVARRLPELQAAQQQINAEYGEDRALVFQHDVHNIQAVPDLFQQIAHELGGLDLVLYASGIFPQSRPNEYNTHNDAETITVNVIGAMAWLNEAAERFSQTHSGTIAAISSVAGERGRRMGVSYNASKAALTSYLESLRNRLAVKGVSVVTIKPGYIQTDMTAGAKIPPFPPIVSAPRAAEIIVAKLQKKNSSFYVPAFWRPIAFILRSIPSPIFRRMNI